MADTEHEGERRSRLRQYQVQLLERMQAAQAAGTTAARELGVLIGTRHCLLDLTQVGEIVPFRSATTVPLTQPWYLGLANVRGNLVGVIDLAAYLAAYLAAKSAAGSAADSAAFLTEDPATGLPAAASESRLLTFGAGLGLPCALLANRALGLRRLADMRPAGTSTRMASHGPGWTWPGWRANHVSCTWAGSHRWERTHAIEVFTEGPAGAATRFQVRRRWRFAVCLR
jgi:twitching motility protein PilI